MSGIEKAEEIADITRGVFSGLIDEIRLSFGYYENQHGRSVTRVFMSGGMSGDPKIKDYFETHLGIAPVTWDPLKNFILGESISKDVIEKHRLSLAVAAGLAVRTSA